MSRATLKIRNFAKRLIAFETQGKRSADITPASAFHVCEMLRPQLATLMGTAGFRALLSRALALGGAEVQWLRAVHIKADGTFEGLDELAGKLDMDEIVEGRIVLLAQLLGLLTTFIGENLILQLVCDVWPELPLKDLDFGIGAEDEKTK